ncbi:MAG: CPBP family intramembrane metalloprotease, partial [Planctomycetales bacterium]|nr:CPBP family intramembrane metalloprotease [Planctomycetales bacterium]
HAHIQGADAIPTPEIFFNGAKDRSRIAYDRVNDVLSRWRSLVVKKTLEDEEIPTAAAEPFRVTAHDMSEDSGRRAALWSKILPFVAIIWALTGAFYPAIDLCAGEKERGTLETLLSSPAERQEIVWGKMITVLIFSLATSLLNLGSMAVTGTLITSQLGGQFAQIGPPPFFALGWLLLALIPLAAIFSAASLALAAMAKSSKEGQYYLMPLMVVTMPLAMIPLMPSVELNLGNSLVPITGVMLLLRSLMEGEYLIALKFFVPVTIVTGACCLLAVRWAIQQFNDEAVLFRESERLDLGLWLMHLVRDRQPTPSLAQGFLCAILLLVIGFFGSLAAKMPTSWTSFAVSTVISQIAFVATPVLIMTIVLTRSFKETLLLRRPSVGSLLTAVLLAILIHPAAAEFAHLIQKLYPLSPTAMEGLARLSGIFEQAPVWQVILVLAVLPAICEELAFRGFILSGLRKLGNRKMAIIISSFFFGIMHGILQQSVNAAVLGLVLGYIAVQSCSILPCMAFHVLHNSSQLLAKLHFTPEFLVEHPGARLFLTQESSQAEVHYSLILVVVSIVASTLAIAWLRNMPHYLSAEERLSENIERSVGVSIL